MVAEQESLGIKVETRVCGNAMMPQYPDGTRVCLGAVLEPGTLEIGKDYGIIITRGGPYLLRLAWQAPGLWVFRPTNPTERRRRLVVRRHELVEVRKVLYTVREVG